jgi:hypothetical protein
MYKPAVFSNPFANNVIGHVIPNAALWGTTALMVGAFALRYRWVVLIVIGYMLIEELFLKLGIYEHIWWRTFMTGIIVMIYLSISKIGYAQLFKKKHMILRDVMFFLMGIVVLHTPSIIFLLLRMQFFHVGWVSNSYRESILFGVIYHAIISLLIVISLRLQKSRYFMLVPLLIYSLCDYIMFIKDIMILVNGLNLFWLSIASTLSILTIILLEHYTWRFKQ